MARWLCTLLACIQFSWALPVLAQTEKRVALVIGNSAYDHVPSLANPTNDATDIAAALRRLGFEVLLGLDADDSSMRRHLRDFANAAESASLSLVYFAGHGIEVDGKSFLIPTNAELKRGGDAAFEALPLASVMRALARSSGVKIVLVDACRNNPFAERLRGADGTRSIGTGLSRVDLSSGVLAGGVLVSYAAREGTLALDGDGRNSPYASAILQYIEDPELEISKLFRRVRDRVFEITDGAQEPFTYSALPANDIYLAAAALGESWTRSEKLSPVEQLRREMHDDFAAAQDAGTVGAWNIFLNAYGGYPRNPLVVAADRERGELVAIAAGRSLTNIGFWSKVTYKADGTAELTKDQLISLQKALNFLGHDAGGADGIVGRQTRNAISTARLAGGLAPGAVMDRDLLRLLPDVAAMEKLIAGPARSRSVDDVSERIEPRLARAIANLPGKQISFDYFKGRLYVAVLTSGGTWSTASDEARSAGGYLVAFNTPEEFRFVVGLLERDPRFFELWDEGDEHLLGPSIGLYQLPESVEPDGGWVWVTGEPVSFRAWGRDQPDNWKGRQGFARLQRPATSASPVTWDDTTSWIRPGFLIEIE